MNHSKLEALENALVSGLLASDRGLPNKPSSPGLSTYVVQAYETAEEGLSDCKVSLRAGEMGIPRTLVYHPATGLRIAEGNSALPWRDVPLVLLAQHQHLLRDLIRQAGVLGPKQSADALQASSESKAAEIVQEILSEEETTPPSEEPTLAEEIQQIEAVPEPVIPVPKKRTTTKKVAVPVEEPKKVLAVAGGRKR